MIARTWRGSVSAPDAERYTEYLRRTGLAAYAATPGNLAVFGLRRLADERADFLLISLWDSHAAVRRFAGSAPDRAIFYPEDDRFLVRRDEHVDHFEVVHLSGGGADAVEPASRKSLLQRLIGWWLGRGVPNLRGAPGRLDRAGSVGLSYVRLP